MGKGKWGKGKRGWRKEGRKEGGSRRVERRAWTTWRHFESRNKHGHPHTAHTLLAHFPLIHLKLSGINVTVIQLEIFVFRWWVKCVEHPPAQYPQRLIHTTKHAHSSPTLHPIRQHAHDASYAWLAWLPLRQLDLPSAPCPERRVGDGIGRKKKKKDWLGGGGMSWGGQ